MNKQDVIEFFNGCAENWDNGIVRNEPVIQIILDNAGVEEGMDVLDVACGTGVLFPDYIKRKVNSVTGIDISPKMAQIAAKKCRDNNITVLCGDAENMKTDKRFDCIVVYNAFPHFPNPERLIENLSSMLKPDGILTVAHSMSREMLEKHHSGRAKCISRRLADENELADVFGRYLSVTVKLSDSCMYQVAGRKQVF